MSALLRSKIVSAALAITLGAVFLIAAAPKIADPHDFARILYHYRLLGPSAALPPVVPNTFAVVLPWIEALTGVLLITGVWRREAAVLAALMLVMFLFAVGWTLAHGIDIENCGCFSVESTGRRTGWALLAEDTLLLGMAGLLLRARPAQPPPPAP